MVVAGPNPGLEALRRTIADAVRGLVTGDPDPATIDLSAFDAPAGDPGLFGPTSVAWRIGADPALLVGGVRALLLQTVHPLAMAGVADHSAYRADPWGRLQRTAGYVAVTTYGSTAAAHRTIERVTAVHRRVNGVAPDGRPYDALDPELLRWVHVTEVDSFLRAVQTYGVTELDAGAADAYHREMAVLGRLMGADDVPESVAEAEAYFAAIGPELRGSAQAREAVRFLAWPPVPARLRPAYVTVFAAAVAILPPSLRDELWLPELPAVERIAVRPAGRALGRFLGWALGASPVVAAARRRTAVA